MENRQLISYIAPGAPATRRPATGKEPFLRPEIGFTPKWYRERLGIDFGERWHRDVAFRRDAVLAMRGELRRAFPGTSIGCIDEPEVPLDLITGVFGACTVGALYGLPILYWEDNWPICAANYLNDEAAAALSPPDLDHSPLLQELLTQVELIAQAQETVPGYVNWQGVLNNAHRLRGEQLFVDLLIAPDLCCHLFECVCTTMIDAAKRFHAAQRAHEFEVRFFTVSNCLVNLVSPLLYEELLLPFDKRIAAAFGTIGIHNCAWSADPYMADYAGVPGLAYIDMGIESNMRQAKELCPSPRRAIMYKPTDIANKTEKELEADLWRIAREYGPCDLVAADIEAGTPDGRVRFVVECCRRISDAM